jgi:hypothetical protein
MATTATLATLRGRALDLADLTNSSSPSSTYINTYINDAICELHDLLVGVFEDYYRSLSTITIVGGTESYSLPSDFYKALKVFALSGTVRTQIRKFSLDELEVLSGVDNIPTNSLTVGLSRYRILGDKIYFAPVPSQAGSVELWYVSQATQLSGDSDKLTVYAPVSWWDEYVSLVAAVKLKIREESDASALAAMMERCRQRIVSASKERDAGEPARVVDVSGRFLDYPFSRSR